MLPAVVAASGDTPVLFDSGVRSGTDVVKALTMGHGRSALDALMSTDLHSAEMSEPRMS